MTADTVPRNMAEKNSVCMTTIILNEHDFLPQYIEHHVKCGISQFIFLVFNYGLKKDQPPYWFPQEYKHIITFININKDLIDGYHRKTFDEQSRKIEWGKRPWKIKKDDFCSSGFVQYVMTTFAYNKNIIKTEWVMSIAIDQYLNITSGQKLPEWLGTLDKNCNHVAIPWGGEMFHSGFQMENTFSGIMKQKGTMGYFPAFGHSLTDMFVPTNSLCKTKAFSYLDETTHVFVTHPDPEATIHVVNEYVKADELFERRLHPKHSMWNSMTKRIEEGSNGGTSLAKIPIYSVHFRLRGFTEMFIGNISWHFCKPDYNLHDIRYNPWNHYAKYIRQYLNKENNGDFTHLFVKLSGDTLGNRDDPRRKDLPQNVKEKVIFSSDDINYPFKDITISNWEYRYKMTTNHYDALICNELVNLGINRELIIEIFNINLKARSLPLITDEIKRTSPRNFFIMYKTLPRHKLL